jgi:hypothetical protein
VAEDFHARPQRAASRTSGTHGRRDSENADETTPQVTDLTPASAELPEECRLSRRPCLPVWSPGWAHGRDVLVAVGGGGERSTAPSRRTSRPGRAVRHRIGRGSGRPLNRNEPSDNGCDVSKMYDLGWNRPEPGFLRLRRRWAYLSILSLWSSRNPAAP